MNDIDSLGIDVGSTTIKAIGLSKEKVTLWRFMTKTGPFLDQQISQLLNDASSFFSRELKPSIVATGYGRKLVRSADIHLTEITCHAEGVFFEFRTDGTLVDLGGQDSKVILIGKRGEVIDFVMNDKCSAGSGRFLENIAHRIQIPIEEFGTMVCSVHREERISSTCTVFAESEVISLLSQGADINAILRGLHRALIKRISAMVKRIGFHPPLILSGGVSLNHAIRLMLEEECGAPAVLPEYPQFTAALGAALIGLKHKK